MFKTIIRKKSYKDGTTIITCISKKNNIINLLNSINGVIDTILFTLLLLSAITAGYQIKLNNSILDYNLKSDLYQSILELSIIALMLIAIIENSLKISKPLINYIIIGIVACPIAAFTISKTIQYYYTHLDNKQILYEIIIGAFFLISFIAIKAIKYLYIRHQQLIAESSTSPREEKDDEKRNDA